MAKQYYKLPLQVLPPHHQDLDGTAFVFLLNPTGGVLQGDHLSTKILLKEKSKVLLTTPSSNKFYKMDEEYALVEMVCDVKKHAILEYLPDYNILFSNAKVRQKTKFYLDSTSTLFAWDIIVPGRISKGEAFQYDCYDSAISIYVEEELIAYEHNVLKPKEKELSCIGLLEGNMNYATIYIYSPKADNHLLRIIKDAIKKHTNNQNGAASLPRENLIVAKIMSKEIRNIKNTMKIVWDVSRRELMNKESVCIRKY